MKTKHIILALLLCTAAHAKIVLPPGEVKEPTIIDHDYPPPRHPQPMLRFWFWPWSWVFPAW